MEISVFKDLHKFANIFGESIANQKLIVWTKSVCYNRLRISYRWLLRNYSVILKEHLNPEPEANTVGKRSCW